MDLIPYPSFDPVPFNTAEAYIHRAAQFLAMMGKHFVPAESDDSHANVEWDEKRQCLLSRKTNDFQLALHLPTFSLDWMHSDQVISYFPVDKTRKKDIYSWLCNQIGTAGFDVKKLKYIVHYEIPEHPVDRGEPFQKPDGDLIDAWIVQRSNANVILGKLNSMIGQDAEIRIWPHHFDTGTYYPFGESRAIGAGWAIGDDLSQYPYLYVYPWMKDNQMDLSAAPSLNFGEWKYNGWTGAMLSALELQNQSDPGGGALNFLSSVLNHYQRILDI